MPELNPFNKNIIEDINSPKEEGTVSSSLIEKKIEDLFLHIGTGTTCVVVEHPLDKEKVVALSAHNLDVREAKDIYYSSKIYNTLFPNNFPKINFASGEEVSKKLNGTIRERVRGEMVAYTYEEEKSAHTFGSVSGELDILREEPYNLHTSFDGTLGNFIQNENGTYYVDTLTVGQDLKQREKNGKHVNIEKIAQYMKDKGYSDLDIKKVTSALNRLLVLYKDDDT